MPLETLLFNWLSMQPCQSSGICILRMQIGLSLQLSSTQLYKKVDRIRWTNVEGRRCLQSLSGSPSHGEALLSLRVRSWGLGGYKCLLHVVIPDKVSWLWLRSNSLEEGSQDSGAVADEVVEEIHHASEFLQVLERGGLPQDALLWVNEGATLSKA